MVSEGSANIRLLVILGVIGLFGIVTLALAAATLGTLNKRLGVIDDKLAALAVSPATLTTPPMTTTLPIITTSSMTTVPTGTTVTPMQNETLATSMDVENVLQHLRALQDIADRTGGNRAVNTLGFNQTLVYIKNILTNQTNFNVSESSFPVRDFALSGNPVFIASIDGDTKNYTYSNDSATTDFLHTKYSTSSDLSISYDLEVIPNGGCVEADWQGITSGRFALVKRAGGCTFRERVALATRFNFAGVLFYNSGTPGNLAPLEINLAQNNTLPVLFLSYSVGDELARAASDSSRNVTVQIGIELQDLPDFYVGNICADTPSGNVTQTIVVGSHSDSVPAGPGINDNGSGSAANLGLAIALARLYQTSTYTKYNYRVRFCWWGAEEIGLLGSDYHVKQAKNTTEPGERLQDYLINLNYDMLGSPNFIFGIYDGKTANNNTPAQALPGSNRITDLFCGWFVGQNLPWNYTDFSGRSDYGPFLAEGIVAGGLFSGGDGTKTTQERDQYDALLGQGLGGIAGITYDPCYHKACDSIQNINRFALAKMAQAAAYVLEHLGQRSDLKAWLYPNGTTFDPVTTE